MEIAFDGIDPENNAIRSDEGRKLDAVIATLPEEFRTVLVLREMEDLSYREIAAVCEVPIGTVMSRLARARGMLQEKNGWAWKERGMSCERTLQTQAYLDELDAAAALESRSTSKPLHGARRCWSKADSVRHLVRERRAITARRCVAGRA